MATYVLFMLNCHIKLSSAYVCNVVAVEGWDKKPWMQQKKKKEMTKKWWQIWFKRRSSSSPAANMTAHFLFDAQGDNNWVICIYREHGNPPPPE